MRLFAGLVAVVGAILAGVLIWDLMQERLTYPDKKVIIYAGMFGPGEPMQQFYAGPSEAVPPKHPFGPTALACWRALIAACPEVSQAVSEGYRRCFRSALEPAGPVDEELVEQFRRLDPQYIRALVAALGQRDGANRLKLYYLFARLHPRFEKRMILTFERLHPAYKIGMFEDFERLHPDYKVLQRWDGRWVLSSNRPRFLTGADVPDLITGAQSELRILMRENLALPLDKPLPPGPGIKPLWTERGIVQEETAYDDPERPFESEFYDWLLAQARYEISQEDYEVSGNPYEPGQRVLYILPRITTAFVVFYNRAHFELIGRDRGQIPRTVAEFEQICRQLRAAGKEPIAQDGVVYTDMWWDWLVWRTLGYDSYRRTVLGGQPRFAGPDGDPRYLQIAQRLRRWRDEMFWMKGFSASKWPGAQRDFGRGKCTFLLCGTWLPAEIASTRVYDPKIFELGCFFFPPLEGGAGDQDKISTDVQGYVIPRDGRNHEGAVLLLRYLTARSQEVMVRKLNYIPTVKGVAFPPVLRDIEPIMVNATAEQVMGRGPMWYSPKFAKFVIRETQDKFFVIRSDNLTPEQFVQRLEDRAQEHYRKFGKGT